MSMMQAVWQINSHLNGNEEEIRATVQEDRHERLKRQASYIALRAQEQLKEFLKDKGKQ
jgi:hypothetical protein